MQEISGSANTITGSYKDLKYAHLEHDDDKFNSNKDIDYEKTKFNQHHYYLSEHGYKDEDDFLDRNYEQPIQEMNEKYKKQRQKTRILKDYAEYEKQREQVIRNRGSKKPYGRNRLLTRKYGTKEDKEEIYNQFLKHGVSIEEITRAINAGFHESTKAFNERYKERMMITESFTHLDEGADHTHDNFYGFGRDKFGKPYTDINQSLHDIYGGKKHKYNKNGEMIRDKNGKPKEFKKNNRDVWKEFRDEMDKSTVEHVNAKLIDLAKDKGFQFNAPKFVRKNVNEHDYEEHDIYKANAQRKDKLIDDLVLRFPDKKLKKGKDKTDKGKVTKPIKDEGTQAILRHGDIDSLMNLYKMLESNRKKEEEKKEKELKEREEKLKQQEEEQKRKDDELNRRENQLEERERRLSISEYKVQQDEQDAQNMLDFVNNKALEIDEKLNRREEQINENAKQLSNAYKGTKKYLYYKHIYNKATKSWNDEKRELSYDAWLRKKQFWLVDSKDYIAEDRLRKNMKREAGVKDDNNLYVKKNKEKDDTHFDPADDD